MWMLFGLVSAFSDASKNIFAKQSIKSFDTIVVTWALLLYSLIILIPFTFLRGIPQLDNIFWAALLIRTVLEGIALILYFESLKTTDISLCLPVLAFIPLFLLITGIVINNEVPTLLAMIGIAFIMLGTYFLNFRKGEKWHQPFFEIFKNKGVIMMFFVSILWGITGALHKVAIIHSNPFFYSGVATFILAVIFTPIAFIKSRADFKKALLPKNFLQIMPSGLFEGVAALSQMVGQSLYFSVLVISIKRVSIVFSSLMAWFFFGEPVKERVLPILIIIAGIFLLAV